MANTSTCTSVPPGVVELFLQATKEVPGVMESVLEATKEVFAKKIVEDDRVPLYTFQFPGQEETFGLFAPRADLWKQMVLVSVIVQMVQIFCAVIVYNFIIPRRGSAEAYLMGWAVLIPLTLWTPYAIVEYCDLQNLAAKTVVNMIPMAVLFRVTEAMYRTSPPFVEDSLWNYTTYYIAGVHHIWDPKTKQRIMPSLKQVWMTFWKAFYAFHILSLSLSFMLHHSFTPFHNSPVVLQDFHINLDMFHPAHLANGYCLAVHTYFHLRFCFEFCQLAENLKGYAAKDPFRDPIWSSTSPRDFWGRRWNLVIHETLKRGAFEPCSQFLSRPLAMFIAFLMSGLLHEYSWSVTFYHHSHSRDEETGTCSDCYAMTVFKLTSFFVWNGVVMMLERPLRKYPPFSWISKHLPIPIISTLVLSTALPVSHWFTGDWVVGGFFRDWSHAVWLIRQLD